MQEQACRKTYLTYRGGGGFEYAKTCPTNIFAEDFTLYCIDCHANYAACSKMYALYLKKNLEQRWNQDKDDKASREIGDLNFQQLQELLRSVHLTNQSKSPNMIQNFEEQYTSHQQLSQAELFSNIQSLIFQDQKEQDQQIKHRRINQHSTGLIKFQLNPGLYNKFIISSSQQIYCQLELFNQTIKQFQNNLPKINFIKDKIKKIQDNQNFDNIQNQFHAYRNEFNKDFQNFQKFLELDELENELETLKDKLTKLDYERQINKTRLNQIRISKIKQIRARKNSIIQQIIVILKYLQTWLLWKSSRRCQQQLLVLLPLRISDSKDWQNIVCILNDQWIRISSWNKIQRDYIIIVIKLIMGIQLHINRTYLVNYYGETYSLIVKIYMRKNYHSNLQLMTQQQLKYVLNINTLNEVDRIIHNQHLLC
ncbi:unnamed protein product [Paramecium sonneborni]|uniref:Uncharacterized protein n=1 Tax=Paramecium sonneborni TaxID=65129 RepID=A0A8S1RT12_9CILI|nr:unnamed protein product [Paramecium sonneborni]